MARKHKRKMKEKIVKCKNKSFTERFTQGVLSSLQLISMTLGISVVLGGIIWLSYLTTKLIPISEELQGRCQPGIILIIVIALAGFIIGWEG